MKRLNFNIKDRKVLYMILGIVFISVFTLTVAYAALNAVLNISGSAQVSSAEWDVHFDNIKVINGSVSGDDPRITSATTATFSTVLNMPGEFYEFTIDVVNDGSIDAMIENITKTPTLTSEQAKYLKYDITYQNGESITTRQLVEKNSFVRLKVRLEYRSDVTSSDLPKTSETLTLGLKLDYIQSDGSGSVVSNGGIPTRIVSGDLDTVGSEVCIGNECFYVISDTDTDVTLFAKYNLRLGSYQSSKDAEFLEIADQTGLQDEICKGALNSLSDGAIFPINCVIEFANDTKKGTNYNDYEGSLVEEKVLNYKNYLESYVDVNEARLINLDELNALGCSSNMCQNSSYEWMKSTSFWTNVKKDTNELYAVYNILPFSTSFSYSYPLFGVRPVIVVSKSNF